MTHSPAKSRPAACSVTICLLAGLVLARTPALRCEEAPARAAAAFNEGASGNPYSRWKNGPPSDPGFFPIAVWLQDPRNAAKYKAAGINVYVGLWKGPTETQLKRLRAAEMPVICRQDEVGLRSGKGVIIGWMHGDEPDNAQSLGKGKGYGPPVPPAKVAADYKAIRAADPTRPVLLNLGQGVAWDGWHGRGVRTNHPEDYPRYIGGCDIASFDIYPAVHKSPAVAGKLGFVPRGVKRLRTWSGDRKIVWNCIECTRISNPDVKPTPQQVKAEVWLSLVQGSMGLIYFVHEFRPKFIEAGLLADREMLDAVTAINRQIHALAPVLNSPSRPGLVDVFVNSKGEPVRLLVKEHAKATYVFAVSCVERKIHGDFTLHGFPKTPRVEVLGEKRSLKVDDRFFADTFRPYEVHIYKIAAQAATPR